MRTDNTKEIEVGVCTIRLISSDITEQDTDSIVNAANSSLLGGGGVDGAIHRRGGDQILKECMEIRRTLWPQGLPIGKAVITSGGNLKTRNVIHTVGPVWRGGSSGEKELLASAYRNSLELARKNNLSSISFASISTGAYGFPIEKASVIALSVARDFLLEYRSPKLVVFVLFGSHDLRVYLESAETIFGGSKGESNRARQKG